MSRPVLFLAVAALVAAADASAHGRSGLGRGYVSTVAGLKPNVLGVVVVVLGGDDRLRLSNYSGKTIVILGYEREPYLRFDAKGVWANTLSPATHLNRLRRPPPLVPGVADSDAPPRWRLATRGFSYEWHDHRIHWTATQPPPAVKEAPREVHLIFNWRVPGRADGKPFAITGFLGYVPPSRSTGSDIKWVVLAAATGFGAAALVVLGLGARRRRRAP
jgi:hypothetical protein